MKNNIANSLLLATSVFAASGLHASPITLWQVDVDTRFDLTSVIPSSVTQVNDKSLRWGNSTGSGQSGLDITDSPSTSNVTTNGAAVPNVKVTHLNRPITGTSLTYVDILSTLTLTPIAPPGSGLPATTITFGVNYKETPNGANPCADGGANGVGVNVNGCADIFVISQDALNFEFFYDDPDGEISGRSYFISFFELTAGLNPLPDAACGAAGASVPCLGFETPERTDTTVQFASVITTQPVNVPEPGILGLFGAALGMLGFARRWKKA